MYLYELLAFLLDLLTFAWWENLLNQLLYCVIVHCVCIDMTTELVEVPALPAQHTQQFTLIMNSDSSTRLLAKLCNTFVLKSITHIKRN